MILVVGGIASGKRSYVRSLGYGDPQMSPEVFADAPVLLSLEAQLRLAPLSERAWERVVGKDVVCCLEVGSGVVPIDSAERAWRALVGRTCSALAREADGVVRLVCGIPVTLKEGKDG